MLDLAPIHRPGGGAQYGQQFWSSVWLELADVAVLLAIPVDRGPESSTGTHRSGGVERVAVDAASRLSGRRPGLLRATPWPLRRKGQQ